MPPTKEERDAAQAEQLWRKAGHEHALRCVTGALDRAGMATSDQGGLVVEVHNMDGAPIRYFVRLTEVAGQ